MLDRPSQKAESSRSANTTWVSTWTPALGLGFEESISVDFSGEDCFPEN